MRPKNLRILFSMALALGLSAQSYGSETVSEAGAGQFLLYNVGAKQYLCPGNAWGTHASIGKVGMMVELVPQNDGTYRVSTEPYYKESNNCLGDNGFVDNHGNGTYIFQKVEGAEEPTYKLVCGSNTLYWSGTGTDLTLDANAPAEGSEANAQWRLVKIGTEDASENNPLDMSYLITNPDFDARGNQNGLGAVKGWNGSPGADGKHYVSCAEKYNTDFDVYQEKTGLPNGRYRLSCQGFYRAGGGDSKDKDTKNAILYANAEETPLMNILEEEGNYSVKPNNMAQAQESFSAGLYKNLISATL